LFTLRLLREDAAFLAHRPHEGSRLLDAHSLDQGSLLVGVIGDQPDVGDLAE